jgi:hypothetical protein
MEQLAAHYHLASSNEQALEPLAGPPWLAASAPQRAQAFADRPGPV